MVEEEDFASLLEKSFQKEIPLQGDIVQGQIISIMKDYAIVDFGFKLEGLVPLYELKDSNGVVLFQVGDSLEVYLEKLDMDDGLAILSREKAASYKIWDQLEEIFENDGTIEGNVLCKVKGGLSVDIGVKAFLPASQIDVRPSGSPDRLLGKKFKFKIIKLNKRKGNVIVSRRTLLEKNRDFVKQDVLQNLKEGQTISGVIKNLTDYGAFVDLGGIDGLLHVTDMSWGRVGHPSELLQVGQDLTVKILRIDPDNGRVSLGLKQTTPDPWADVFEKYPIGSRVKGKIVNVTDYGAFTELQPGVEGLIHVSEMSWSRKAKHPSKIVALGDMVEVVILDMDLSSRRISLGMKQIHENPWKVIAEKYPVGSTVRGPVRSITDFGIFVGLAPEVDGLVHISDIRAVRPARPLAELHPRGTEVEAVVLNMDQEAERTSLGMKQLSQDPWPRIREQYAVGTKHEGKIVWIGDRGIAVELEEKTEGFIERDPADERVLPQLGDTLPVIVHSLDERDHKILLGMVVAGSEKRSKR